MMEQILVIIKRKKTKIREEEDLNLKVLLIKLKLKKIRKVKANRSRKITINLMRRWMRMICLIKAKKQTKDLSLKLKANLKPQQIRVPKT